MALPNSFFGIPRSAFLVVGLSVLLNIWFYNVSPPPPAMFYPAFDAVLSEI